MRSKSIYIPAPLCSRGDQLFLYRRAFASLAVMQKESRQSRIRVKKHEEREAGGEVRSERRTERSERPSLQISFV